MLGTVGRKDIVESCPYNVIFWNEELQLPQTWIFDAHLLDQGWKQPRCQQSCPTGVYSAVNVDDEEMKGLVEKHQLEVLQPELNTKPRVYYKNLHRFNKCFIGGTVVAEVNGVLDCVAGARVVLKRGGREMASMQSDTYGDFKFDKLEPGSGDYEVEVTHPTLGTAKAAGKLGKDSQYIGEIKL